MTFETTKDWLAGWANKQANLCRVKGVLGLVLGPICLGVALTAVYYVARLFSHDAAGNLGDSQKSLWITLAVLPLLFIGNAIVPRRNLMEERMAEGGTFAGPVARWEARKAALMWFLFTGPRLINWSIDSFRSAKKFAAMDFHSCAAVLWVLMLNPRRVPYDEVMANLDWLNLEETLPQLQMIEGVLFLKTPPPGLTLVPELRAAIRGVSQ